MNPDIKDVVALMAAEVKGLKRSRPDEVSSSESFAKKAATDDQDKIVPNHKSRPTSTPAEPKLPCPKCGYVAKNNSHLKSHYFYQHLTEEEKRQIAPFICDFCPISNINSSHFANHVMSKHNRTISPKVISDRKDWSARLFDMIQKGLGSASLSVKARASVKSPSRANTNPKKSPSNKKPVCTLTKESKPAEISVSEQGVLQSPDSGSKQVLDSEPISKTFAESENCEKCTELVNNPASLRKHQFLKHMTEKEKRKVATYKCDRCLFSSLINISFARHLRNVHGKPLINAAGCQKVRISQNTEPETPDEVVSSQDFFSCPDCGNFKAEDQKELLLHMEKKHGKYVIDASLATLEEKFNIKFCSAKKSEQPCPSLFYCQKCSFTHYQTAEMTKHYKFEHKN